jgi:hypothetical protein
MKITFTFYEVITFGHLRSSLGKEVLGNITLAGAELCPWGG